MFLVNSRLDLFSATPFGSIREELHLHEGPPSPEVTVVICRVPEREFSQAPKDSLLVYLCRFTVRSPWFWLEVFLGSAELAGLRPSRDSPSRLSVTATRICLRDLPTRLDRDIHHPDRLSLCVTPLLITNYGGTGMLTCFPSTTPFGLALGAD